MPTVIKASDRNASIHATAFNFTDMVGEADQRLGKFRDEAQKILAEAKKEADSIRRRAEVEGRQAAEKAVREKLAQEQAQRLASLLPAMQSAINDIQHAKQAWLAHWEKSAIHVAGAIAERLIRRELPGKPEIPMTLIREALELAVGSDKVRLHLNPADYESLGPQVETMIKSLSGLAPAEIVSDEAISPGGCRVETQFGAIDQQFEAQLARIEEELTL